MLWRPSPSLTELEEVTLGWLRDELGLPPNLFGIINDTASINSFLALAAARESLGLGVRTEGMAGREPPRLRVSRSADRPPSIAKGALAPGLGAEDEIPIPG